MSSEELYEIIRGIWKLDMRKLDKIRYVFGVYHGVVKEVYEAAYWNDVGSAEYKFRKHEPQTLIGRSEFVGHVAPDEVRGKYIGKRIDATYQAMNYYNC